MSALREALAELESALDAQSAALTSADPAWLERCNATLEQSLSTFRRLVRAGDGAIANGLPDSKVLDRMKQRLDTQSALTARAAGENRRALQAIGLDTERLNRAGPTGDAGAVGAKGAAPGQQGGRTATHLLA